MPAARRFPELGLRVSRELESIEPIETLTRVPRMADPGCDTTADGTRPELT
jgi:hypothetical protein